MAIKVNAKLLRACAECVSKEETRYYLNGVYVQPHPLKGAILIATDGHRMIVAHDVEGHASAGKIISLDRDALAALVKVTKSDDGLVDVSEDGILSVGTYRGAKSAFIDGTFPDWAFVLGPIFRGAKASYHGKPVRQTASFNGSYLGSFGKIANILSPHSGGSAPIRLTSFTDSDPALILFPNNACIFGVLMPMSATVAQDALPAFMKEILEPSKKPAPPKRAAVKKSAPAKRRAA